MDLRASQRRARTAQALLGGLALAACTSGRADIGETPSQDADSSSASASVTNAGSSAGSADLESTTALQGSEDESPLEDGIVSFDHPSTGLGCYMSQCDIWDPEACGEGAHCVATGCCGGGDQLPGEARCTTYWDSNICVLTSGDDQLGEACTREWPAQPGIDSCAPGLICWGDEGDARCLAYCAGSEDAPLCSPGSSCVVANTPILPLCLPECDPLAQDCSPSETCIPNAAQDAFVCALDASGNQAPSGTPCTYANSCNRGLVCLPGEQVQVDACEGAGACCTPICDLLNPLDCPQPDQSCQPFLDPSATAYATVGSCQLRP